MGTDIETIQSPQKTIGKSMGTNKDYQEVLHAQELSITGNLSPGQKFT